MRHVVALVGFLLVALGVAQAATPVPAALEPWRAWVLDGLEYRACPLIAGKAATGAADFVCAWPGTFTLEAREDGASFTQDWRVDIESWVPLPGDARNWPQEVQLDGKPAVVVDHGGPALRLAAGTHRIAGRFSWRERPQGLGIPRAVARVALRVDGRAIEPVERDGATLALGRAAGAPTEADHLEVRVFRKLDDGMPPTLETVLELGASGQVREEVIGPVLPPGFEPLALDGDWPARLDADGRLRVRVEPGSDALRLRARALAPLATVHARLGESPWPTQEIWSYAADPAFRTTVATGGLPVDPEQAGVPQEWRALPAFALGDSEVLAIAQRSRGLGPEAENQLALERELWLDFDGDGWYALDKVVGTMRKGWRLDVAAPWRLEQAQALTGRDAPAPLLVTQGAIDGLSGVEWSSQRVSLRAGLRVDTAASTLPVAGWQDRFDSIRTTLQLPPGWRLLAAPGADEATGSWVANWTLFDVFLAAILAVLAWRALGPLGGLAAIGYLLLGYQEPGAPLWSLLIVLVFALIGRELPAGRLATANGWLRRVALLVLVVLALPFVAGEVRQAVYPQLDSRASGLPEAFRESLRTTMEEPSPMAMPVPPPAADKAGRSAALEMLTVTDSRARKLDLLDRYGASTVVQTGGGEPAWRFGPRHELRWAGPVLPEQEMRLVLAPPWLVRSLRILLVALLAWLLVRLLRPLPAIPRRGAAAVAGLALLFGGALGNPLAAAEYPPPELLQELRIRLVKPPECAPRCAEIGRAEVVASGDSIELALDVHAAAPVAVPVPWDQATLVLQELRIDGAARDALAAEGNIVRVPLERGVHRIQLRFAAAADKLALAFPLVPREVSFRGSGWEASGLAGNRLQAETLALVRARSDTAELPAASAQQFAPFVRVLRTVTFNLDWQVETWVERLAPDEGGFTVEVPLLPGEHVVSEGVQVEEGRVRLAVPADADGAGWSSRLDKTASLRLTAPALAERAEAWNFSASPTWHVEFSGIPESSQAQAGDDAHHFGFLPLPGETLEVTVSRPQALEGATRAVDAVNLSHELGQRAATSTLVLDMRASQGGEHLIHLPPDAELVRVVRDGTELGLRAEAGALSLPLVPGKQHFEIRFRSNEALGNWAQTPVPRLGLPATNIELGMNLPSDRWLLFTRGPTVGPAVLYWGELLVLMLVAFALARLPWSPLRGWQWLLLGAGFSTVSWAGLIVVAGWLFAFEWRRRSPPGVRWQFNLAQVALVVLTFWALLELFLGIQMGLVGSPDMHVAGHGSTQHQLRWFADRASDALPEAVAFTVPVWIYRAIMLAWSLWLAAALVRWLRQAFGAWMLGGYWRSRPRRAVETPEPPVPQSPGGDPL